MEKPTILVVFLNYDPDDRNKEMTDKSRQSIFDNGGHFSFLEVRDVKGFVNAVNKGFEVKADHYIFVANDVVIDDKNWIEKMTVPNAICGWRFGTFYLNGDKFPDFACFSLSREIYDKVGGMDVSFQEGYGFDDNDFTYRIKEAGYDIKDAQVKLKHLQNVTYNTHFGDTLRDMTEHNKRLFLDKLADKLGLNPFL